MTQTLPRRRFLRALGGAGVALPLLDAMGAPARGGSGLLAAASGNRPRRLIVYFIPNGTIAERWFPRDVRSESEFTLAPIMGALEPHRKDLLILQGVDNKATLTGVRCPHRDIPTLMSGWGMVGSHPDNAVAGGITVDQIIARKIDETTPLKATSVQVGVGGGLASLGPGRALPNIRRPPELFRRLFGDAHLDAATLQKTWVRRKSVLDELEGDYRLVLARLGAEDRHRLDIHLESLRVVEKRIAVVPACRPAPATLPDQPAESDHLPAVSRAFLDTLVLGMACDVTRVAGVMLRQGGGGQSYFPWLGLEGGYADAEHHELSHFTSVPAKADRFAAINSWFVAELAYLIERLKATPDGEGNLFDTTGILVVSECGNGQAHSKTNMPFLLAGSLGGAFRTGRLLRFEGAAHNQLLLSLLHAFGIHAKAAGNPKLCPGPLPGLA